MREDRGQQFTRFLLTLRLLLVRTWVPFVMAMCLMLHGCALSMGDLEWGNPKAKVVSICDKPLDVPEGIDLWAWNKSTDRLVTGENALELRLFAVHADVLFHYDEDAPPSSVKAMPAKYGLTCKKPVTMLESPAALFESSLPPCSVKVAETQARPDVRFLAQQVSKKPTCDPTKKKPAPPRIHVCVRPPWVKPDVSEWAVFTDLKASRLTGNAKQFAEDAAHADAVFVFDSNAPPETVYWFVKDPKELSCPDKAPPRPYEQVQIAGTLVMLAAADSMKDALGGKSGQGDGKTTETSSADGKGPPLTFVETVARNLAIAQALASADTSGSLKDPHGSRYGIPNGKNVDGFDLLPLQLGVSIFALIGNPLKTSKEFISRVNTARAQSKVAGILDPNVLSKELAEKLAQEPEQAAVQKALDGLKRGDTAAFDALESFGKAMAPSLREAAVILPYSRAQIFTKGWGGKFQAHHLFEVHWMEILKKGSAGDAPAVILSKAEHEAITLKLGKAEADLRATIGGKTPTPAQVWAMYQQVYKNYPSWLNAIEHYFQ